MLLAVRTKFEMKWNKHLIMHNTNANAEKKSIKKILSQFVFEQKCQPNIWFEREHKYKYIFICVLL